MKTLVLGGGVVGVTTAYFLAKAGHEVTLLEEKHALGLEATGGNAGIIAPGHSFAWASPRAPQMLFQSLRGAETAIRLRLTADPELYAWGLRFLRECTSGRARRNTLVKLRLCQYSQRVMKDLVRAEGLAYHEVSQGALYLHRDPRELEAGIKKMALLAEHGQKQEILDGAALARLDPVFEPVKAKLAGAIRDLGDGSGDARVFSEELMRIARDKHSAGVRLGTRVTGLRADGDRIDSVVTSDGLLAADNYVLALGVGSARVARTVGVRLPIYPAKGYSATLPIVDSAAAPTISITDDAKKIVFTRLGDRLRVAGTAELSGYDLELNPVRCEALTKRATEWFGAAIDPARVEYWTGLRPATPSNVPLIGRTRYPNLYLNAGHGTLGWTMAAGSGKAIAEIVSGRKPDIAFAFLGY